jgi:hypothetical protein
MVALDKVAVCLEIRRIGHGTPQHILGEQTLHMANTLYDSAQQICLYLTRHQNKILPDMPSPVIMKPLGKLLTAWRSGLLGQGTLASR